MQCDECVKWKFVLNIKKAGKAWGPFPLSVVVVFFFDLVEFAGSNPSVDCRRSHCDQLRGAEPIAD